jgi:transketolase
MNSIELASRIRKSSLEAVYQAKASHIGSALSIADIVAVLYGGIMTLDSSNSHALNRDRFILSKGHACVAVYAVLAEIGFISHDSLKTYGQDDSWLMNHISHKVDGVEFSTGALGHGLSFGVGKALASRLLGKKWRTFVLLSDGEMDEGSNWEALMFAAHHKLGNLTAVIDYNKLQSLDSTYATLNLEPLADKLIAFGCTVVQVNGHDHNELACALGSFDREKPTVVIADTIKGKGVSFMEDQVAWHYKSPNLDELKQAISEVENSHAK